MRGSRYAGPDKDHSKPKPKHIPLHTKASRKGITKYQESLDKLFGTVSRVKDKTRWSARYWG